MIRTSPHSNWRLNNFKFRKFSEIFGKKKNFNFFFLKIQKLKKLKHEKLI